MRLIFQQQELLTPKHLLKLAQGFNNIGGFIGTLCIEKREA